jgi:hypothetical protein
VSDHLGDYIRRRVPDRAEPAGGIPEAHRAFNRWIRGLPADESDEPAAEAGPVTPPNAADAGAGAGQPGPPGPPDMNRLFRAVLESDPGYQTKLMLRGW